METVSPGANRLGACVLDGVIALSVHEGLLLHTFKLLPTDCTLPTSLLTLTCSFFDS